MTNFWKALELVADSHAAQITYRLYYDVESGQPLAYSMSAEELGDYIEISKEQYDASNYHIVVKDKKIIELNKRGYTKLAPAPSGTACHPSNIMILDATKSKYWSLKTYELE